MPIKYPVSKVSTRDCVRFSAQSELQTEDTAHWRGHVDSADLYLEAKVVRR